MTKQEDIIPIGKFANKHVHKLGPDNTLLDAIELFKDFRIRHIPIEDGKIIKGIVNPRSVILALLQGSDPSVFTETLDKYMVEDFLVVDYNTDYFEVVKLIGENPDLIIIVTEKEFITGIYTDRDVLNTDFPWVNIKDQALHMIDSVGSLITEFNSITSDSGIGAALELMIALKKDHIGVIESGTKILKSVLIFQDIIKFLHHNIRKLNSETGYLLNQSVDLIFPSELLYVKTPSFVSGLRKELYLEDVNIAVLINEQSYPIKIITTRDLVCYLVQNSRFFELDNDGCKK